MTTCVILRERSERGTCCSNLSKPLTFPQHLPSLSRVPPMIRTYSLIAALTIAISSGASAQADKKVDVTGKWLFNVVLDVGTGTPTVTFKQQGDSVTGHYSSQTLGEIDFKGTV